jgi:hypothetical protein
MLAGLEGDFVVRSCYDDKPNMLLSMFWKLLVKNQLKSTCQLLVVQTEVHL